jgi:L-iditol 2-dehydrogenase
MKALYKTARGKGHLELKDAPVPKPSQGEILIRVHCCGVCGSDLHIEDDLHPYTPPVVIGHEFSGTVEGKGPGVTMHEVGDRVGFLKGWMPYPGVSGDGGFELFMLAPQDCMWKIPEGISLDEASQFETLGTPMVSMTKILDVQKGEPVVVTGVGMIGLSAIGIASVLGAKVYAVGAERDLEFRLPLAKRMGAYKTMVFGEEALAELREERVTKWMEASGAAAAAEAAVNTVEPHGIVTSPGMGGGPWNINVARMAFNNITLRGQWGGSTVEHMMEYTKWMRDGRLDIKPLLSTMPLTQWRQAFDMLRMQKAVKILLDPSR